MNNSMNLFQMLGQLKSNPMALLSRRFNIPANVNNPNEIIQHLLNTGQITQANYNQAANYAKQMQNNPQFSGLFKKK